MNFVVIGSLNMDFNFKVPHLPAVGETLKAADYRTTPGGKGANQAVALARLGGEVLMIGAVGSDDAGKSLKKSLSNSGVDVKGVKEVGEPTGRAFITVDEMGDNTIIVFPGANDVLEFDWVCRFSAEIKKASYAVLQLEVPLNTIIDSINLIHDVGTRIILNPAPAQKIPDEVYSKIDIITPNESELSILTGMRVEEKGGILEAARVLLDKGVPHVVVTLGAKGCLYMNEKDSCFIDSFKVNAVDSTAAGDAFTAGLAVALSEGRSFKDALTFAGAAGALTVTKPGAQESLPFRQDVEDFLRRRE
ncbi:ribokinase [Thermoanaerobacterium sp. DL9XJH110]|uniref:ribokinase n=1 Tax=Thermoanaerobacterium sp. DL9XJH110 TaxID=3386643 RepID=UPI003BB718B3